MDPNLELLMNAERMQQYMQHIQIQAEQQQIFNEQFVAAQQRQIAANTLNMQQAMQVPGMPYLPGMPIYHPNMPTLSSFAHLQPQLQSDEFEDDDKRTVRNAKAREKMREYRSKRTDKQVLQDRLRNAEQKRLQRQQRSEEQLLLDRKRNAELKRAYRARRSEEQIIADKQRDAENKRHARLAQNANPATLPLRKGWKRRAELKYNHKIKVESPSVSEPKLSQAQLDLSAPLPFDPLNIFPQSVHFQHAPQTIPLSLQSVPQQSHFPPPFPYHEVAEPVASQGLHNITVSPAFMLHKPEEHDKNVHLGSM